MSDPIEEKPIPAFPAIPHSAQLAIEFLTWSLEKEGMEFSNGATALHWHLISVVSQHLVKK